MKRNLLYFLAVLSASVIHAQNTFSDDIESYQSDSYVGASSPNWRTWSTTGEGTDEDAIVTTEVAHSGKQSIRLEAGSSNQGPTDLVLPFGGEKNLGTFIYNMYVYVTADNSAYWNFQAKATIGTTWALDNYVTGDGRFIATLGSSANGNICDVEFPHDTWVKYTMVANMTRNQWEILINDKSVVKFSNPNNTLAYIDIFPLFDAAYSSSASLYYIDDVSYEYQPYSLKNIDAGVLNLNVKNRFLAGEASVGPFKFEILAKQLLPQLPLPVK